MRADAMAYRPDIEGLRALAILFVVGAHAGLGGLTGGFTGVDVFFVLSGYLITGQLISEKRRTGTLEIAGFYARRMRRLMPVALFVLLISLLLAWQLMPPSSWREQAFAGAAAAAWMSNLHFAFADLDYFGSAATDNLFLHTWSLSVEEQLYLVWPLLLLAAARMRDGERAWRITLWMVLALSLMTCLLLSRSQPLSAFYLMPSRAWQFALGGLAWLHAPQLSRGSAHIAYALGLLLLSASGWGLHDGLRYPGYWALLPSLGTVLLLVAGDAQPGLWPGRFLAMPLLQWIGRRSYSWYLWHWPVLLVGSSQLGMRGSLSSAGLVVLALVLAIGTYVCIERPARNWSLPLQHPGKANWAGIGIAVMSAALVIRLFPHQPSIAGGQPSAAPLPLIYSQGCDDWYRSAELKICGYGHAHAQRTVMVVGDSVGLQWFPALHTIFSDAGWKLLVMTKSSCPMVDEPIFDADIGREFTECQQWRHAALQAIVDIKPQLVLWGSTDRYSFTPAQWAEGTARALATIVENSERVVVIRSTPTLPFDATGCIESRTALYEMLKRKDLCVSNADDAQGLSVLKALQTAAQRFGNVSVIDFNVLVCPGGICQAARANQRVYRDQKHLDALFVAGLSPAIKQALQLPQ